MTTGAFFHLDSAAVHSDTILICVRVMCVAGLVEGGGQ